MTVASPQMIGKFATRADRALAACMHLSILPSVFLFWGMGSAILPGLLWVVLMTRSPLVDHHGRASTNFALWVSFASALAWGAKYWALFVVPVWSIWILGSLLMLYTMTRARRGWQARDIRQAPWTWLG